MDSITQHIFCSSSSYLSLFYYFRFSQIAWPWFGAWMDPAQKRLFTWIQRLLRLPPLFLTNMSLTQAFNRPLYHLPRTLTSPPLRELLNHPFGSLPPGLTQLSVTGCFNQPVYNLPTTITRLRFSSRFNQPGDHLPHSSLTFHLDKSYLQPIRWLHSTQTLLPLLWW